MPAKLSPKLSVGIVLIAVVVWAGILFQQMRHAPAQQHIDAGNEYARRGDGPHAIEEWRKATELEPNNLLAWQLIGQSFYEGGIWRPAKEALLHVRSGNPDTANVTALLAVCSRNLGEMDDALKYGREQLKHDPNDTLALEACIAALQQNPQGAAPELLADLHHIVQLEPTHVEYAITLAKVLMDENNPAEAITVADQILKQQPDNAEIYALRGFSRFFVDGSASGSRLSEADLTHALKIDPKLYIGYLYMGKICRRRSEWQRAATYLEKAAQLNPARSDPYFDLSTVYAQLHQRDKAAAALMRFENLAKQHEQEIHQKRLDQAGPSGPKPPPGVP